MIAILIYDEPKYTAKILQFLALNTQLGCWRGEEVLSAFVFYWSYFPIFMTLVPTWTIGEQWEKETHISPFGLAPFPIRSLIRKVPSILHYGTHKLSESRHPRDFHWGFCFNISQCYLRWYSSPFCERQHFYVGHFSGRWSANGEVARTQSEGGLWRGL